MVLPFTFSLMEKGRQERKERDQKYKGEARINKIISAGL